MQRIVFAGLRTWTTFLSALALFAVGPRGLQAQDLVGDCNGDGQVYVDELILSLDIALDKDSLDSCPAIDENEDNAVSVDELLSAIRESLGFIITRNGDCLRPGPNGTAPPGLIACDSDAPARLWRCEQREECLHDPNALSLRDDTVVESDGGFSLEVNSNEVRGEALVIDAEVDSAQRTYRTMDFGSLGAFGSAFIRGGALGGGEPSRVTLSPVSEAAVRMIDENGLENYVDAGIPMIIAAVATANADTNFAGQDAEQAVVTAQENAQGNEGVNDELSTNRVLLRNVRLRAELRPAGDVDLYGFTLREPEEVVLEATVVDGSFVPCLEIRSASNVPVSDRECGSPVRVIEQLGRGTFLVLVSDEGNDGTGMYDVSLVDPQAPSPTTTETAIPTTTETPTPSPSATATMTPTETAEPPTSTPTATATSTETSTVTPTRTFTFTSTPTPTATATGTPGAFVVNSTEDVADLDPGDGACATDEGFCTLRAALQEVNALGFAHVVTLPAGVYTLTSGMTLIVDAPVVLAGAGMGETIIQAADEPLTANFGVFGIFSGAVEISGVTIRNGRQVGFAGALQVGPGAVVSLRESILSQNRDAIVNAGSLSVSACSIEADPELDFGDGISTTGRADIQDSSIRAGGGLSAGIVNSGELVVSNSEVSGGLDAIFNELMGTVTITGSTLRDSRFGIRNLGIASLSGCSIVENTTIVSDSGAGVTNGGILNMVDTTVSGNTASDGAGLRNIGTATLRRCTISGNRTSGSGGSGSGGGVWNSGTLLMENCTLSGNEAEAGQGGAVWNTGASSLTMRNCTLSENSADTGGGVAAASGSVQIANTIVAGNSAGIGPDCQGSVTSLGFNLVGDTGGCDFEVMEGDLTGSAKIRIDPLLGPLQANGGPTLTHSLSLGSPAIEAGSPATPGSGGNACEATDQRSVARPQGARCDIGAFEAPAVKL